jgi:predicted O-methyltransferase YrrM
MYKKLDVSHIKNRLDIKGDVNLDTEAGKVLYSVAKLPEVNKFLELGTQFGTSAECIALGLNESSGHLDTVEFIKERHEYAKEMLKELPVTCHLGKSFSEKGVDSEYKNGKDTRTMSQEGILEKLISKNDYQAVFLDTCRATQSKEFNFIEKNTNIKYVIMHEPNIKCSDVLTRLRKDDNTWKLLEEGYDKIRNHKVHYTLYMRNN